MRRALFIYGLALAALMASAPGALAAWQNGAEIVSVSLARQEQANAGTRSVVISGNGRYVVFETRATNLFAADDPDPPGYSRTGGVFRRDLESGALELEADGTLISSIGLPAVVGAQNPSISHDGRFVAFQTFHQLAPADATAQRDVYVRDMEIPIRSLGAFELISAKDGGDVPASYGGPLGSETPTAAGISSDGTRVLFRTNNPSDLPDSAGVDVAPGQLFIRDRTTKATTLVTRTREGLPAGGADWGSLSAGALSADGTTVVWAGRNALSQTLFLNGENASDIDFFWLWRRVADGSSSLTRRITGQVDLDDHDCPLDTAYVVDPTASGPCYGPLSNPEGANLSNITDKAPAISADGRRVAFLTAAQPRPTQEGRFFDVYVTGMAEGISRKTGTVELTRDPSSDDQATSTSIERIALSADGRWLAFTTTRVLFPYLTVPTLVGAQATKVGEYEIYVVDLPRMEMERAVKARNGDEVNGSAESVSLSADGGALAFISGATNLFPGDLNGFADSFVATRSVERGEGEVAQESLAVLNETRSGAARVKKRLTLGVARLPGGRLRVRAHVPEAGVLNVRAMASIPARRAGRSRSRTLARARARADAAGTKTVVLRLSQRYLARIAARKRIKVRLLVRFRPTARGEALRVDRTITIKR